MNGTDGMPGGVDGDELQPMPRNPQLDRKPLDMPQMPRLLENQKPHHARTQSKRIRNHEGTAMRKPLTAITTIIITIALASCASSATYEHEGAKGTDCIMLDHKFDQCTITMNDTRRVTCITYTPYKGGGIDCDWTHADGNDNQ